MKKDRLSYSALSQFSKSPNHLLSYWQQDFEPTSAMLYGSLVHKMILQPESFSDDYVVFEGTRRGNVWNEFKALNDSKTIVTAKEYNHALKTFNRAKENKVFRELLMQTTQAEKHIEWKYNGIKYHGFCDMVGDNFIADIKTCQDAGDKFARDLRYNDYSLQATMYLTGLPKENYYIIAVEKSEPYNVQVYKIGDQLLSNANKRYYNLNEQYKNWDGSPQSYNTGIVTIGENEFVNF
tara:strand:- start:435 stop:1145 length:711 start_codon:yes stop_codon:yes gene_type:complete